MSPPIIVNRLIHSTCLRNVRFAAASIATNTSNFTMPSIQGAVVSPATMSSAPSPARFISTNGQDSIIRFKAALEDYRTKNYAQTIPPRFRKEITSVMMHGSNRNTRRSLSSFAEPSQEQLSPICSFSIEDQKQMAVEDIERFLQNIGALGENKVTHEDVERIVSELGESAEDGDNTIIRADKIVTKLL